MKSLFCSALLLSSLIQPLSVVAQETTGTSGSGKNPDKLVFVFQKQKDPRKIQETAEKVAELVGKEVGIPVEVVVPSSYGASVQALVSNKAQVAYVSAMPYLLAKEEAPVELIVAEERNGKTDYNSIFVVAKDSPYKSLEDLKGKHMIFTSPTSTSGYVMAVSRLVNDGLLKKQQDPKEFFNKVSFGGGYDKALLAVANGQADACAVSDYTMEGAKADVYLKPADRAKLRILTRTPGVPTHGICVRTDLPKETREKIKAALLALSEKSPELLADVYGASKLVDVDSDEHVKGAKQALENTGIGVKKLVE